MGDWDSLRPPGTVQVPCSECEWHFWVQALDPRLPDGPFLCTSCDPNYGVVAPCTRCGKEQRCKFFKEGCSQDYLCEACCLEVFPWYKVGMPYTEEEWKQYTAALKLFKTKPS